MPILPLIDALILLGTGCLVVGGTLKFLSIVTRYHPAILGLSSTDFLMLTGVFLGLALVLAARSWVKLNQHRLLSMQMWGNELPEIEDVEVEPIRGADLSASPPGESPRPEAKLSESP